MATTNNTARIACTNLNEAQVGQWVKKGSTRSGVYSVEQIVAIYKNGNIKLDVHSVFRPEPRGVRAYKTGEHSRFGGSTVITAFDGGETVDGVLEAIITARAAASEERKAKEEAKERLTQLKIKAAWIQHHNGRDVPGSKVATWFDSNQNARTTLYFAKVQEMYGGVGYSVQLADFENGAFGSSHASSMISPEDAVNRWIAACWGTLPE